MRSSSFSFCVSLPRSFSSLLRRRSRSRNCFADFLLVARARASSSSVISFARLRRLEPLPPLLLLRPLPPMPLPLPLPLPPALSPPLTLPSLPSPPTLLRLVLRPRILPLPLPLPTPAPTPTPTPTPTPPLAAAAAVEAAALPVLLALSLRERGGGGGGAALESDDDVADGEHSFTLRLPLSPPPAPTAPTKPPPTAPPPTATPPTPPSGPRTRLSNASAAPCASNCPRATPAMQRCGMNEGCCVLCMTANDEK